VLAGQMTVRPGGKVRVAQGQPATQQAGSGSKE
jgi:hypothetical protein